MHHIGYNHTMNPNPAVILMNNKMIMDMQSRGGNGGPPNKWDLIIMITLIILSVSFILWITNVHADDFGVNNCGLPCYSEGAANIMKTKQRQFCLQIKADSEYGLDLIENFIKITCDSLTRYRKSYKAEITWQFDDFQFGEPDTEGSESNAKKKTKTHSV